jgi:hypothetical protein
MLFTALSGRSNAMLASAMFAELLKFNIAYLARTIDGVTPEKFQIRPEGRGNPLIWLMGHLVLNRGEIVEILGGNPSTRDLGDYFARGTRPLSDSGAYPKPAQLMTRFIKLASLTDHLLKNCQESVLDRPSWGQFESVGQNLMYSYMHETHHIGQITYVVNLPAFKVPKKQTTFGKQEQKKESTTKLVLDSIKSVFT